MARVKVVRVWGEGCACANVLDHLQLTSSCTASRNGQSFSFKIKKQKPPHTMEIRLCNKLAPISSISELELAMLDHLQRGYSFSSNGTYKPIFS